MNESFGMRVKQLRMERNWSQQELSLRSGISTPHISSLERAKRFPSLEYSLRIAATLGVPLNALCDESEAFVSKMVESAEELPIYLQSFILREEAGPYLKAAHRMSTLPKADANLLTLMIDLLFQKRRLGERDVNSFTITNRGLTIR